MVPVPDRSGTRLLNGQYLATNEYIQSPNGSFFAMMQSDGNFCVYAGPAPGYSRGNLWNTDTGGTAPTQYVAMMQDDGNFGLYHGTNASDRHSVYWHAGVSGSLSEDYQLRLENDGRLLIAVTHQARITPDLILWMSDRNDAPGPAFVIDQEQPRSRYSRADPIW
jgi:hypothetical protein